MPFPMCWLKIGQNEDLLHNLKNFAKFLFILNDKKIMLYLPSYSF